MENIAPFLTLLESAGPNPERFLSSFGRLVLDAETVADDKHKRVVVFGEMVALLCAQAGRKVGEERNHLLATKPASQDDSSVPICPVELKDVLGDVQPDDVNDGSYNAAPPT